MSEKKYKERIYSRIREDDVLLQEHFSKVKDADYAHEIRRLLEIGILAERYVNVEELRKREEEK